MLHNYAHLSTQNKGGAEEVNSLVRSGNTEVFSSNTHAGVWVWEINGCDFKTLRWRLSSLIHNVHIAGIGIKSIAFPAC